MKCRALIWIVTITGFALTVLSLPMVLNFGYLEPDMATHNFTDQFENYASISAQTTDDGEILLSLSSYPMSALFAMPMSVAVKLATDILEQARESMKEAA